MKLALFFTCNISLELWVNKGLFDREKLLYEEHLCKGNIEKVYWLTYGKNDAAIERQLKQQDRLHPDIIVLPMPRFFVGKLGRLIYSFLIFLFHRKALKQADIFKTNQMFGSWTAVIAKWFYKRPLIVRTGWTLTQLQSQLDNNNLIRNKIYEYIERFAFRFCDIVVVAGKHNKIYLLGKYKIDEDKIIIIRNYIDITKFKPLDSATKSDHVIFVGSLTKVKNVYNLIKVFSNSNLTLVIYGSGKLRDNLEQWANEQKANISFKGVVSNSKLPKILNQYRYFILPSLYEGMPKSLLEAMACGLVCIGTNTEGINEIIDDGITGYLVNGTEADDIAAVLNKAMLSSNESIRANGVKKIHSEFSLEKAVKKECDVFSILMK